MYSYGCDYCGESLCPEICPEAKAAHSRWINSKEFKALQQPRHAATDNLKGEVSNDNT